jgi:hypothetical protein
MLIVFYSVNSDIFSTKKIKKSPLIITIIVIIKGDFLIAIRGQSAAIPFSYSWYS